MENQSSVSSPTQQGVASPNNNVQQQQQQLSPSSSSPNSQQQQYSQHHHFSQDQAPSSNADSDANIKSEANNTSPQSPSSGGVMDHQVDLQQQQQHMNRYGGNNNNTSSPLGGQQNMMMMSGNTGGSHDLSSPLGPSQQQSLDMYDGESSQQLMSQQGMIMSSDGGSNGGGSPINTGAGSKPKRAGRRKINIEFIKDKSRRHITFSKRKAGIMKKAYELSTLTGTQVLLLVASETGHVYTFATPKLQPLITKTEGKNLIQACLNAPDMQGGSVGDSQIGGPDESGMMMGGPQAMGDGYVNGGGDSGYDDDMPDTKPPAKVKGAMNMTNYAPPQQAPPQQVHQPQQLQQQLMPPQGPPQSHQQMAPQQQQPPQHMMSPSQSSMGGGHAPQGHQQHGMPMSQTQQYGIHPSHNQQQPPQSYYGGPQGHGAPHSQHQQLPSMSNSSPVPYNPQMQHGSMDNMTQQFQQHGSQQYQQYPSSQTQYGTSQGMPSDNMRAHVLDNGPQNFQMTQFYPPTN